MFGAIPIAGAYGIMKKVKSNALAIDISAAHKVVIVYSKIHT